LLENRLVPVVNFTVNTLGDLPDINVGDGLARDANGNTSLRAAIMEGNAANDSVAISFAQTVTGTITLGSALPNVEENFTIMGPGSNSLTVARDAQAVPFRIFTIADDTLTCSIQGLTLTGGNPQAGTGWGGAVRNLANLTLIGCSIHDNQSPSGGAIYNNGNLTISGGSLWFNAATTGNGGAIYNDDEGTLHILLGCQIYGNGGTHNGGAIYNNTDGVVSIRDNSQIFANSASRGGGIFNGGQLEMIGGSVYNNEALGAGANAGEGGGYYGAAGQATFRQVSFTGNIAQNLGGGFYLAAGSLLLDTCTVSGNTASGGPGGYIRLGATYTAINCKIPDTVVREI
jgi:predicted outer membrane repeat protein